MLEKFKQLPKSLRILIICLYCVVVCGLIAFDLYLAFGESTPLFDREDTSDEYIPADAEIDENDDDENIDTTVTATIVATGDILPHNPLRRAYYDGSSYDFNGIFTYITDYVSEADFAVANLETTLAGEDNGYEYSGYPQFNCPDSMIDALKNAGFDMLLTANNHSSDTGAVGITRTIETVRAKGLLNIGTRLTEDEPRYAVQDINGIKVGMVCYTYSQIDDSTGRISVNGIPVSSSLTNNINAFDGTKLDRFYSEMETNISDMRSDGAEAIVLFIHWGVEYQTTQNSEQEAIAQKMCDLGVDVIVGGHPHVIQPVELLVSNTDPEHSTLCVYSVGNAVSNQRIEYMNLKSGHTEDGMLFSFTFEKNADGEVSLSDAEIIPTWVYLNYGKYYIIPLDKEVDDWKSAFNMGDNGYSNANASYERTVSLIDEGMSAVSAYTENGILPQRKVVAVG